jgi:RNA polymerase sigma-70 factor (ECF subfamily)
VTELRDSDAHLSAIASGDAQAFAAWMAVAEPEIRGSLRRFAAVVDVEAVLQETLLKVWQVAPRHEPDGRPNSLLRLGVRIGRNQAISEIRKDRSAHLDEDGLARTLARLAAEDGTPSPSDPILRRWIAFCREKLPEKPALALTARLTSQGGQSDAELAASLRMKKNTFLQNFTRARKMLAECLRSQGIDVEGETT